MMQSGETVQRVQSILQRSGVTAADVSAGRGNQRLLECSHRGGEIVADATLFLTASLTKPIVSLLAVQLAAEGYFSLNEPVRSFLPEFRRGPLRRITLRHLLTHTSGLPDMLPENEELRTRHATVREFAERTALQLPAFAPAEDCSYCSMGFAVLQQVLEPLLGRSLPEVLSERLFEPLQMRETSLGIREEQSDWWSRAVACELPPGQSPDSDWNWNSRYWRSLGAPWGGLTSTATDLSRLLSCLLADGVLESGERVLSSVAVQTATQNQTQHFHGLPVLHRQFRPWGLGWRFNWPDHAGCFSDFLPTNVWGHWGATGTLMWADPETASWCVILTNQPWEVSQQTILRVSNSVAAALRAEGGA